MERSERLQEKLEQTREAERLEQEKQDRLRRDVEQLEEERAEERKRVRSLRRAMRTAKKSLAYVKNEPPVLTRLEEFGNYTSHGLGTLLAVAGLVLLILKSDTGLKLMASLFYGISMILMFLDSALYHGMPAGSKVKRILRRFDYSSIYLLIGGTFAPIFLVYWGSTAGIVLFLVQWGLILAGILLLAVFGPGRFYWVHNLLYFVIGWSAVCFLPGWWMNNRPLFWMILGGGAIYTLGMIPFVRDKRGDHFIWHLFVLAGAVVHWLGIYFYIF